MRRRIGWAVTGVGLVAGVAYGVPWLSAELGDGAAMTRCMGIASDLAPDGDTEVGFAVDFDPVPWPHTVCRTEHGSRPMGWPS